MIEETLKNNVYEIDIDILVQTCLTPNQWILLNIIYQRNEVKFIQYSEIDRIDIFKHDLYILFRKDYICNSNITNYEFKFSELSISKKGLDLINKEEKLSKKELAFDEFIDKYYNLFPEKVYTGNGLPVRSNLKLCKSKMLSFIKEYKYDYETILKATESYIKISKNNSYSYMKTAYYFIKKDNESILESYCQQLLSNPTEQKDVFTSDLQ